MNRGKDLSCCLALYLLSCFECVSQIKERCEMAKNLLLAWENWSLLLFAKINVLLTCSQMLAKTIRHPSLSNHFFVWRWYDWTRLCLLTDFIFKQRFAVAMRGCSIFSRKVLTIVVDSFPFRNSRISNCVLEDRSASLNFCVESFSQQIVLVSVLKYHLHALHSCYRYLSQLPAKLWLNVVPRSTTNTNGGKEN